jgi:hypothetical protein
VIAAFKALLLVVGLGGGVLAAVPRPIAPATPTATPAPTQTAAVIVATAPPSVTPPPTSTPMPVGAVQLTATTSYTDGVGPGQGPGWNLGPLGTIHWFDWISGVMQGVIGWIGTGIGDVVHAAEGLFTTVPRPDRYPALTGFLTFLLQVGEGSAASFFVFGVVLQLRGTVWGNDAAVALVGTAMMGRAIESSILIPAALTIVDIVLGLAQDLSTTITQQSGLHNLGDTILSLLGALLTVSVNPFSIIVAVVGVLVLGLILLLILGAVAVLAWMVCIGPLALATWPMGSRVASRWVWNLTAVALWFAGWAVWIKIVASVLTDLAVSPLLTPFEVLMLLILGYGIPRLVDDTLGTHTAGHGSGLAGFAVGLGTALASRGVGAGATKLWNKVL